MHLLSNILKWICIPLVLSCLSEAIIHDTSKRSTQVPKNGKHVKKERQTLLRAFVLGDFIPFAASDGDDAKASHSTKGVHRELARKPGDIQSQINESGYAEKNHENEKELENVQISNMNQSSNSEKSSDNISESVKNRMGVSDQDKEDNGHQMESQRQNWNTDEQELSDRNDDVNNEEFNKRLEDVKNENEEKNKMNFFDVNKKQMNEFSRENKEEIKPLMFEGIKPRKNEGRFGDLGNLAFKYNTRNKTQNNSQKRKLGFLKNNSAHVFSEKSANYENISKKGDNGLIDAPPSKLQKAKTVPHSSSSDHIEESRGSIDSTSKGIVSSKANKKALEHLKNSGENAESLSPEGKGGSFVETKKHLNNDVGDEENENKSKNKTSFFDVNKNQMNEFSRVKIEEIKPLMFKGIKPWKNKDRFGDLGYVIVNQRMNNKTQNNSEKRKLPFLKNTASAHVNSEKSTKYKIISLKNADNGLIGAPSTKTPRVSPSISSNYTHKKIKGISSTSKDLAKSKSNKTKLTTKRHYNSSILTIQTPYKRRVTTHTNYVKMSKDALESNSLPSNTQSTVKAKQKTRNRDSSSNAIYSKRKTLGLSLVNNNKKMAAKKSAYSNITSKVVPLKKTTPTIGRKSVPSKHKGDNSIIYSKFQFGKIYSKGKKRGGEKRINVHGSENEKEITVERNGFKNKITIEQNLPETSEYDLYILKVPPIRNIRTKTKKKSVVRKKKQDQKFGSLYSANQSYIESLENQMSLFRKILNIPVKTIFDLFVPYMLGKSKVDNMKLKDITKNLVGSSFSSKALIENIPNITINTHFNKSSVFLNKDFKNLSHSVTDNSKYLTNRTKNLKRHSNTGKKDTFNYSKPHDSEKRNVSKSLVKYIGNKGTRFSNEKSSSASNTFNFLNNTHNKTILHQKVPKKRLKLLVKSKNKTIEVVQNSFNRKTEKLFSKNSSKENIKVFLNPSLLEQDKQGQNSKKSFTPESSDDVFQATKSDESKPEVNTINNPSELLYDEHKTISNKNNPYFISLTGAIKTKRKAIGTEVSVATNTSKSSDDANTGISSGEMSLRSNIGDIQSSNLVYPGYQNTAINQNNGEQFTNGVQNGAPGFTAASNMYWGNSNPNVIQKTETSGEIDNYRQFGLTRLPVTNAQFTFRIRQNAQKPVVNQRQEINSYQQPTGDLQTPYKGVFGNTGIDLETSCINYGKQDFVDNCPTGWASYKQFCFMAMPGGNRWSEVAGLCSRDGAKMAMPKSQDVLAFLVNMLTSLKQYSTPYFLGLRKKDEEWEWIDDTPLSQGLPDGREDNLESCAVLLEGSLRKMSCNLNNGYICEVKTGVRVSRILAFGDSLTKGYFNGGKSYHPYGEKLEELLNRDDHGCFVVEISGKNGEKTSTMVHRLSNYLNTIQRTFNWVVLLAGTNDLLMTSDSSEAIADQIEIMHEIAHARGAKSIAVTIPEIFCEQTTCPNIRARRKLVNKRIRLYASSKENKVFLSDLTLGLSRHRLPPSDREAFWEPSGVHMKPRGYNKMAEIIFKDLMEGAEASTLDK